jgi:CAAX prenyl protease-like protein
MQPTVESAHPDPGPRGATDPRENESSGSPAASTSPTPTSDLFPYLIPMCAYVALGALEAFVPQVDNQPSPIWYLAAYTAKLVAVACLAWWCRSTWKDLRPFPTTRNLALSVLLGLVVWGLWVGLDGLYPPIPLMGRRVGFDPTALAPIPRSAFIVVRLLGLIVLVPLIEELFWRSFLIRWLVEPDFRKVPIGHVNVLSGGLTSVCFALVHPEWLPALLTGLLWAWLLRQSKSVSACVVSHATANLALGVYIIMAGAWQYW